MSDDGTESVKENAVDKKKNSIEKNGSKKSEQRQPEECHPQWRSPLNAYRNKQRLVFENEQELEKAIDLLWTAELRDLPHGSPDGRSLVIPAEAVEYFTRAGLKFAAKKLMSISDLSPEEIAALRR